ncbi:MAG: Rpn family recombination-promoting nuclease/putative transposase [Desulfobacterales bacterium]|nr:Rpn family recombination-promoting nuclease/putative transposase [Desulfobacterales bacterium]
MAKLIRFDWAMKYILRNKANFDILEGFLAALLSDNDIKVLNLLESEGNQDNEDSKFNRVDIMIEDSQHRKIIVEIQNCRESDYLERLLYGASKVIVDNQRLGVNFKDITKVISISVLYFNLGIGDDYLYYGTTDFKGVNTGNTLIVRKRIEFINGKLENTIKLEEKKIFPEYYLIQVERYQNEVKEAIDEWIYMIKNNEVKEGSKSKNIDKAREKLAEINMLPEEKVRYEKYLINMVIERDVVNTAKEEGFDIGEKKGIEKGIEIERVKWILKDKERVKKLVQKGLSLEEAAEIMELSLKDITENQ